MRRLIAWLHSRFPVQLVVSVEEYQRLLTDLNRQLGYYDLIVGDISAIAKRLAEVEAQIKRLNAQQGFTPGPVGPMRLER